MDVNDLTRVYDRGTQAVAASGQYHGLVPEIVRTGFEAGGSELAGFLIGRYSDTLQKTEVPIPLVAGAVLKIAGIALDVTSEGRSRLAPVLHGLGGAGMNAFFVLDGVARGHASKNEQLYLGTKNQDKLPAGMKPVDRLWGETPANTAVGHIPQAPEDGQWFNEGGLRHFANS